jgi:multidrug efflux pump subunit AcrB
MDRPARRDLAEVRDLVLNTPDGRMVPLAELIDVIPATTEPSIYHKNLRRVTYVTGEVAGAQESPIYGILNMKERIAGLRSPDGGPVAQLYSRSGVGGFSVKWDGEWRSPWCSTWGSSSRS